MNTLRQQIFSDGALKIFIEQFRNMPDRLKDAKDNLAQTEFATSTDNTSKIVEEQIATLEAELSFEIANEINGDGKKIFTNEKMRDSELRRRLSRSTDYVDFANKLLVAKRGDAQRKMDFAKERNQFEYLKDRYFTDKAILEAIAGLSYESMAAARLDRVVAREGEL